MVYFVVILSCIVCIALGQAPDECTGTQVGPTGFFSASANACFEYFETAMSYPDAKKECEKKGATVARPTNMVELNQMYTLITNDPNRIWIGIDDIPQGGDLKDNGKWGNWFSSASVKNIKNENGNCIMSYRSKKWNTVSDCSAYAYPYVCQFSLQKETTTKEETTTTIAPPSPVTPDTPSESGSGNVTVVHRECLSEPTAPEFVLPPGVCKKRKDSCKHEVVELSNGKTILCDTHTDGGGWVVFQRQTVNGSILVDSGREEFIAGFGQIDGTFWMGLDNIHALCNQRQPCELRAETINGEDEAWWLYKQFHIAGRSDNYTISIGEFENSEGGARDILKTNNGKAFVTKEDTSSPHYTCISRTQGKLGGWWYGARCQGLNMNAFGYLTEVKVRRAPPKMETSTAKPSPPRPSP